MTATAKVLTRRQAEAVPFEAVVEATDRGPADTWGGRCHEISLAVLRTGLYGPGRVARGWHRHLPHVQHSWIVLGNDPYDKLATVVDPTIIPALDEASGVRISRNMTLHFPHGGEGNIWVNSGPPAPPRGEVIELDGYYQLSPAARMFLEMCGYPFDYRGWGHLVHGPIRGWPAGEIITAMCATPKLASITPIDIVGMTTDLNPKNLYW